MDSSTIAFLVCVIIGFIIVKRQNAISKENKQNLSTPENDENDTREEDPVERTLRKAQRPITDDMIEIVQTMAPTLDVEQIRYSLQKTGSIESTIEAFLSGGDFPFPQDTDDSEHFKNEDNTYDDETDENEELEE